MVAHLLDILVALDIGQVRRLCSTNTPFVWDDQEEPVEVRLVGGM